MVLFTALVRQWHSQYNICFQGSLHGEPKPNHAAAMTLWNPNPAACTRSFAHPS